MELTGNEIFKYNRLEGFSNISQHDSFDAQISVKAEVIANMMNQMSTTSDPKLLGQLKQGLMAAAFGSLVQNLPPEQQAAFEGIFGTPGEGGDEGSPIVEKGSGQLKAKDDSSASVASDAGAGALQSAKATLEEAQKRLEGALKELNTVNSAIASAVTQLPAQPPPTSQQTADAKKAAGKAAEDRVRAKVEETVSAAKEVLARLNEALADADKVVAAAIANSANLPAAAVPANLSQKRLDIAAAKSKVSAAGSALTESVFALEIVKDDQAKSDALDALKKVVLGTGSEPPVTIPKTIEDTSKQVESAQAAATSAGVSVAGAPPTPAEQKILTADKISPADRVALNRLPKFREVLKNPTADPSLNLRQLLMLTASDKMTLEILRWLTYPRDTAPNKQVYLCVASVNVMPGRTTYRGYNAQVDLMLEYAGLAGTSKDGEPILWRKRGASPTTFAVFPFIDSQVLDLRTSRRQAFSVAMQLVLTGYPAAANALLDYARQRESDTQTLTGINTVTSYSSGNHIGFTFAPRLVAQASPSDIDTAPAMTLQPQTIPVLILVVCDRNYLGDGVLGTPAGSQESANANGPGGFESSSAGNSFIRPNGEIFFPPLDSTASRPGTTGIPGRNVGAITSADRPHAKNMKATHLLWRQSYRWMRAPDPGSDKWWFGQSISEALTPTLSESEMLARARNLDKVGNMVRKWQGMKKVDTDDVTNGGAKVDDHTWVPAISHTLEREYTETRLNYLRTMGIGQPIAFQLPLFKPSSVRTKPAEPLRVSPNLGWVDQPSTFFVDAGSSPVFDRGFQVSIGGRSVNASPVSATVIKVVTPAWNEITPVTPKNDAGEIDAPCVPVVVTVGSLVLSTEKSRCIGKNCKGECGGIRFVYNSRPAPGPGKKDASTGPTAKIVGKGALITSGPAAERTIQIEVTNPPRLDVVTLRIETTASGSFVDLKGKLSANGKLEIVLDEDKNGSGPLKNILGLRIDSVVILADGDIRIPVSGALRIDLK